MAVVIVESFTVPHMGDSVSVFAHELPLLPSKWFDIGGEGEGLLQAWLLRRAYANHNVPLCFVLW